VLDYSAIAPGMETNIPNLLLANTTQIVNSTLNNNEMVKIAGKAVDLIVEKNVQRAIHQPVTEALEMVEK